MSEHDDFRRKQFEDALSDAEDALRADPSVVFGSESEKVRRFFGRIKTRSWVWERSGFCMFRGCAEKSIRHSHSIQRSGSIERIAEIQHVLTPRMNHRGQMKMQRTGINVASTFPGFCEKHEQLFSVFEASRSISTGQHVALQAFRTLCRELFRTRQELAEMEALLDEYRTKRTDFFSAAIHKVDPSVEVSKCSVRDDEVEKSLFKQVKGLTMTMSELANDLYSEFFEYLTSKAEEPCLYAMSLPFEVPISLSGLGTLSCIYQGKRHRVLCLLGVMPQAGTTLAFIGAERKHSAIVERYYADMEVGFGVINAMESWMVNGSDHWFIRPSAWESISPTRQGKIMELLLNDEDGIGSFVDFSILDKARREIIDFLVSSLEEAVDRAATLKMIETESKKLLV